MTRTANQMIIAVGQEVLVTMGDFGVVCKVQDVKQAWGNTRLHVTPMNGTGEAWVDCSRCSRVVKSNAYSLQA